MRTEAGSERGMQHSEQEDMEVIVSVTGTDNEQIIVTLSEIISRFNGRLQATRFNRLDKTFNGLFYISINVAYFGPFRACLESLNSGRLHFEFSPADSNSNVVLHDKITFEIEFYGLKEKVVDVEILRCLARNQLVVDELTRKRYTCESGLPAYKAHLKVSTDFIFDIDDVERELQLIAEKLDIHLVVHFEEYELQEAI